MSIEQLTAFFAWSTLINLAFLIFATIWLIAWRKFTLRIHSRLFGVNETDLLNIYIKYLAYYKIAFFVFNLVPYLALRIIT
jgi:hypothetical protein